MSLLNNIPKDLGKVPTASLYGDRLYINGVFAGYLESRKDYKNTIEISIRTGDGIKMGMTLIKKDLENN